MGAAALRFSAACAARRSAAREAPDQRRARADAAALPPRPGEHGCRTTDHFAGFQITGRFRTAELVELMAVIPAGQHGADGSSGPLRTRLCARRVRD